MSTRPPSARRHAGATADGTVQIVMASTLFAAAGAAAAVDVGALGSPAERILLVSNAAPVPELAPSLDEIPGAGPVLDRFDRVVRLDDVLHPYHPHGWSPRGADLPVLERLLRSHWGLGDRRVELVLESLAVAPASWLAKVFSGSVVTVHSDGLMSYGPTRSAVPPLVADRLVGVVHLDLVPGLAPVLLREHDVPAVPVPIESLHAVLVEVAAVLDRSDALPAVGPTTAVAVGQYLGALGLLDREEEAELHVAMVEAAVARGAERVLFKPHPSAPPLALRPVRAAAERLGIDLEVLDLAAPVEVLLAARPPAILVGCFSTAIATAQALGIETASVGSGLLLERLEPYENSNRVPVVIVEALTRADSPYTDRAVLQRLVDAVAWSMQPSRVPFLRPAKDDLLAAVGRVEAERYVRRPEPEAVPVARPTPAPPVPPTRRGVARVRHAVVWRTRRARRRLAA